MNFNHIPAKNRAYTLVELMVASAVSSLLIAFVLSTTNNIVEDYQRNRAGIAQRTDLSYALDLMIKDLEAMVVPNVSGSEGLRSEPETINSEVTSNRLAFLARVTDRDYENPSANDFDFTGATRAISYRIGYQNTIDGSAENPSYALYRSVAPAEETFANATGVGNLFTEYWDRVTSPPSTSSDPAPTTYTSNFLAPNVVRLEIRFLRADTNGWTDAVDTIRIGADGAQVISPSAQTVDGGFTSIEVAMTVLSPRGAERLASGVVSLEEAIKRYGRTSVQQTFSVNQKR